MHVGTMVREKGEAQKPGRILRKCIYVIRVSLSQHHSMIYYSRSLIFPFSRFPLLCVFPDSWSESFLFVYSPLNIFHELLAPRTETQTLHFSLYVYRCIQWSRFSFSRSDQAVFVSLVVSLFTISHLACAVSWSR